MALSISELHLSLAKCEDAKNNLQLKLLPLLKETKQFQKEVTKEVERIRLDAELLPQMFRNEAAYREKCRKDREEAIKKMESF